MKLILRKLVERLGDQGDVVDVKAGYARNYLIPHGLAYLASSGNLERLERERDEAEEEAKHDYLEARRRASQLEGVSMVFRVRAGEEGKLFGAVTNADVADRLNQGELDFDVDRRIVILDEPLKMLGTSTVSVRLHSQVEVGVEVQIERGEE
ncbi:MAG TPA: 50S ribosomal protein L9 [Gemmatimonadetes bacterium]|nr:50S ribosomal protein L9 [Gemmatimonadota bacterium]